MSALVRKKKIGVNVCCRVFWWAFRFVLFYISWYVQMGFLGCVLVCVFFFFWFTAYPARFPKAVQVLRV